MEHSGIVDRRLDPEYRALFVVHLDRIAVDPVLDPNSFGSIEITGCDLAAEPRVDATAQESQYILTTELAHGVSDQRGIESVEVPSAAEHHVGGVFGLANRPVVAPHTQARARAKQGIDAIGQHVEEALPLARDESVEHSLSLGKVFDPAEGVVALLKTDAGFGHPPSQVFAPIEADVDREREPGLQSDV